MAGHCTRASIGAPPPCALAPGRLPAACAWLLILIALPMGCAQLPVMPEAVDFRIEGKIGVVEGKRRHTARFIWRQVADQYDIVVWGPFGRGRIRLLGNADHLELTGGGMSVLSGHPQAVMRERLGWSLPLAMMPWWLSGQPAPGGAVAISETDSEGRLIAFRQFGWRVRNEDFDTHGSAPKPRRITAERPGYRIRAIILAR